MVAIGLLVIGGVALIVIVSCVAIFNSFDVINKQLNQLKDRCEINCQPVDCPHACTTATDYINSKCMNYYFELNGRIDELRHVADSISSTDASGDD